MLSRISQPALCSQAEEVRGYTLGAPTTSSSVSKRVRLTTIGLIIFCQSFQALSFGGIALFLPLIRKDLGLSFTQAGTLSAASTLVYALMQIPSGYLADRLGPRRLFFVGVLGSTILSFTFGLATDYWQALANQTVAGFFRALLFVPGISLLTSWFPPNRRATAMGLYTAGGFSGNVLLDLVGPWMVTSFGWRFPFLTFSSVGIVASFIFLRYGREAAGRSAGQQVQLSDALALFRYPTMLVCGVIQYVRLSVVSGIQYWLPTLLVEEKGLSLAVVGLIVALRAALTAPSNTLGGYVSDRLKNPTLVIGVSLVVLAVTTGLFVVIESLPLLILVISVNAVFVQLYFGPLFSVPVEILGMRTAGTSTGFSNFFANLGAFSFVYLLGALKDMTGSFQAGFLAIVGACVVGLLFTVVLAGMRRQALARQDSDAGATG